MPAGAREERLDGSMKVSIAVSGSFKPMVFVLGEASADGKRWHGRLIDVEGNKTWNAVSGPYGKGAAPPGAYFIRRAMAVNPEADENKPYKDKAGLAWFAQLDPQFETDRMGLGIHPDGNVPGTLGCIGIAEENTKDLYELLSKPEHPVMLFVV